MKKPGMKATSVRGLLTFVVIVLIAGTVAGFYFGLQLVRDASVDVSHTAQDAQASGKAIDDLQQLKITLTQSQALVTKANQLFTTSTAYQAQALKDVQKYANETGVTISKTNFDTGSANDPNATANTSKPLSITLQAPVSYSKLLNFLDAIEGNLPKMQVTSMELIRPVGGGIDNVTVGDVKIVVSTR
ncbi:MAG: hypothetical protein JWM52_639 [Candidatus Saccharibacteria bacterium]|nr:hypothetical protein [Candidatus Saccharibacteria bacterium]